MPALVPELTVTDIEASLRFYRDVLGFTVRYERPQEGFAYIFMGTADLMLDQLGTGRDWITGPLSAPFGRGINIQIEVRRIETIRRRLEEANVALFQPMETRFYKTGLGEVIQRQLCVQDPDGYLLRFFERLA